MITFIFVFLIAAILSLLATYLMIRLLRAFNVAQPVREEGPASHQAKAGTPTMGGLGFVAVIIILVLILIDFDIHPQYLLLILLTAAYGLIGLADDLLKVIRGRNLGLTFWQKIFLQFAAAACFALGSNLSGQITDWLFAIFVIVGTGNATNLTDGLNGLLAGTATIAFLTMAILSRGLGLVDATTFSLIAAGAVYAFLYFNFPRAQVFMGDVGSLAIGAALAGLAIIIHQELLLIVVGGVFVVEALSVIVQVASYKLFKKRVFKMAPLHHHFELLGFKEINVVLGFWAVGIALGLLALWI